MKRTFSTEDRTETKLVKVEAIKRGTVSGRYGIFHMDPKGKDPLARARSVRPEVADALVEKKIAKIVGGGSTRTSGSLVSRTTGEVAARRRETSITRNDEDTAPAQYFGSNGADTRDTTAFAIDPSRAARHSPLQAATLPAGDGEPEDDDGLDNDDDLDGDAGDEGNDQDETRDLGPMLSADDAMSQEGTSTGGDTPPSDDDEGDVTDHSGSDQGAGGDATDDTGAPNDQTDDTTKAAAAPAPRRGRRPAPVAE